MEIATKEFLASIEKLAQEKKESIRNSNSVYDKNGNIYYVSENGDDSKDGLSPKNALKTLEKAGEIGLKTGDVILLERGSTFRGHLDIKVPGITVSAYGEGPKPIIIGSPENGAKAHYWELVDGSENIYVYYKELSDIGGIVFDEGRIAGIKRTPHFVDGQFINSKNQTYSPVSDLSDNYAFFSDVNNTLANGRPSVHDKENNKGKLYLRCDEGNPGKIFNSIEFLVGGSLIRASADNLTVDNVCLLYCGTHSIGSGSRNGLVVRNTEIGWGGGCIQFYTETGYPVRFGNGIEIYGGCNGFVVDNCYIYQIYDAGVTHQYQFGNPNDPTIKHENVAYTNNLIEYCIYNIEYFLGQFGHDDQIMRNILMKDNILRFAGYGWGSYYARAAHIKGWDHRNISENFVIENNIFDRSRSMVIHCGVQDEKDLPVIKNNTYIHFADDSHNLGRYCERNSTEFCYPPERMAYTDENILDVVKDKDAKIYFVTEDHVCPGFWPSGMEK